MQFCNMYTSKFTERGVGGGGGEGSRVTMHATLSHVHL